MKLQEKIKKKAKAYSELAPTFLQGAKFALENQWISVDDDLPCNHEEFIKTGGHYLKETIEFITIDEYDVIVDNLMVLYDNGKWEWKYGARPRYWMLIPKLPKEIEIELTN